MPEASFEEHRKMCGIHAAPAKKPAISISLPVRRKQVNHPRRIMQFPENLTWGVAAAAYQIEGAAAADGKGPGVWDMFCRQPGKVLDGHAGETACDHYHRSREDVALMKEIGVGAYRFSISWPRVIPAGTGGVNPKGLDFYDKLVDDLLAAGIRPWATLFHWDYPLALFHRGGWLNRDSAEWFADYARVVVGRLSDRVEHWMTLNEPQCFVGFGHATGTNAPGLKLGTAECLRVAHHVLLAHGNAVRVLRTHAVRPAKVGWAPVGIVSLPPADASPEDIEAARRAMFSVTGGDAASMAGMPPNLWSNTWWADPVIFGRYPEDGIEAAGAAMPEIPAGDMETISQPIDFYGANIYTGTYYRAGENGEPERLPHAAGTPLSAFKWPVIPESLRWGPRYLHERYKLPVVITENGISLADWVSLDGRVHDPQRVDFLKRYLTELARGISEGADVRGYFHWSIMDNFEWAEGYRQRFGLVHVDYETQRRTLKDSALWYRDFIAAGGRIPISC
jgi:beta-glucosidase